MPGNFKKDDLRIIKTRKLLLEALLELLERRNFGRLTVNDLCECAQVSRPTFYAHFKDKYDLLEFWLTSIQMEIKVVLSEESLYIEIEKALNKTIDNHTKIIANILNDVNSETWELLHKIMLSIIDSISVKSEVEKATPEYVILSHFCAGGILNLFSWQIKNNFPSDLKLINPYSYGLMKHILGWEND